MSTIDERIVSMKIDNKQFLSGVKSTLDSLTSLKMALSRTGQANGLQEVSASADQAQTKFSALNVAAMTVVATITNKLVTAGGALLKSLTIDPVMAGFQEYQTNLNSIQTIMANTGKTVGTVNKYLGELNEYSDQTIYNFSQMADSIGKFTAAGVKLPDATSAIKGMANTAALSGSNAMQLNSAMYQMSQALAAGRITLMDWNSLVNANMGGKNVQEALKKTALAMGEPGKAMEKAIKKHGSFRDSLTEQWLSADVFNKTMEVMAGTTDETTGKTVAFSVAQLKAKGYTEEHAKELHKLSQASIDAATQIKTFPQMMDVIKESVGSQFAQVFQNIMGNFNQSKKLWTSVGTTITDKIGEVGQHWNNMLIEWGKMGGRQDLIKGFGNIFQPVITIFKAIGEAWREVFPPATADTIKDLTQKFEEFTIKLRIGTKGAEAIKSLFQGVFSIFKAGITIVGAIFKAIFGLFGLFTGGGTKSSIASIVDALGKFLQKIGDFVHGDLAVKASEAVEGFFDKFEGIGDVVSTAADKVGSAFKAIGGYISDLFGQMDGGPQAGTIFGALITGGVLVAIKKVMGLIERFKDLGDDASGVLENIGGAFEELGGSLKAMQNNIKSKTLMNIAIAVGILAASLVVLSHIKPEKLAVGIGAIGALIAELVGAMMLLSMVNKMVRLPFVAASLVLLSGAILALSVAVAAFGMMDNETIARGLAGVGASILTLATAAALISKFGGSFIFAATSLTILSVALTMMAGAIALYNKFSPKELAQGFGAIGAALLIIGLSMRAMPGGAKMLLQSAALNAVAVAITILAGALKILGSMSMEELGKGLGALAAGLILIAGALLVMNSAIVGAAALVVAAGAISVLTAALAVLGNMGIASLVTAVVALGVALAVIVAAGIAATPAAVGLLALGAAILLIGVGIGAAVLGIAAFVAAIAGLIASIALLKAVGVAGFAVLIDGIMQFLKILPNIAIAGAQAMVAFIVAIGQSAPKIITAFVKIVAAMLNGANKLLPKFLVFINNLVSGLLTVVTNNIPKLGKLFETLISTGLNVLRRSIPRMANTGMAIIESFLTAIANRIPRISVQATNIIVGFINGVSRHISRVITAGTNLIIKFIEGIGKNSVRLANSAAKTLVDFLNGLATAIRNYGPQINDAGWNIAEAIVDGMVDGLSGLGSRVLDAALSLADGLPAVVKKALGIASPSKVFARIGIDVGRGFVRGIVRSIARVQAAGKKMARNAIDTVSRTASALQLKANAQMAKADALRNTAELLRQKAQSKKLSKNQKKRLEDQAKQYEKQAKNVAKTAAATQSKVDRARRNAEKRREFREADSQGRADILNKRAEDAAAAAEKNREKALRLAHQADLIRKEDAKRAKQLDKQAQAALRSSQRAAQSAKTNAQKAAEYATKAVLKSSSTVSKDLDEWLAEEEAEKAYDAMTSEQKQAEMERRSRESQKKSDELIASAREKLAEAERISKTNAQAAQKLVEAAAADVEAAKTYRDKAESEAEEAKQITGSVSGPTDLDLKMPDMSIASSMVYGAQNMFDAYSKALAATTSAAAADTAPSIQFVQNNTSPEALSPTEVYRQSKNLLSNAERKLTGALT